MIRRERRPAATSAPTYTESLVSGIRNGAPLGASQRMRLARPAGYSNPSDEVVRVVTALRSSKVATGGYESRVAGPIQPRGTLMPASGARGDDRDERVGAALAEYDRRREAGEHIDLLGFLSDHMDVAADLVWYLREVLPLHANGPRPSPMGEGGPTTGGTG
jgi:hypothetical protein